MKLVQQTKLHFKEGNSNKVYEAEICEVGDGQYVVNFRYGKHGASLTEGTKTPVPVDMKKAQDQFDKLIKEKVAKGYQDITAGGEAADPLVFVRSGNAEEDRKNAILWHLSLGVSNPKKQREKRWNIKRAIWRAGELRLADAVPHLLGLFGKGLQAETDLYNYCILWSLGRCAQQSAEHRAAAVACLQGYVADEKSMLSNVAKSSLVMLLEGEARAEFFAKLRSALPDTISQNLDNPAKLTGIISGYIRERSKQVHAVSFIYDLYLLSLEQKSLSNVVAAALAEMPMAANFFKHIRAIYKAAAQLGDERTLGTLAARFDTSRGSNFKMYASTRVGGQRVSNRDLIKRSDSTIAHSTRTNGHFRRQSYDVLTDLAATATPTAYIRFATAYLLQFDDNNAGYNERKISNETKWHYDYKARKYNTTKTYFPPFASALAFGYILYSTHELLKVKKNKWTFDNTDQKYNPEEDGKFTKLRREAHAEYWDAHPQALAHLVIESNCEAVFNFALRAFQANPDYGIYAHKFDLPLLLKMMGSAVGSKVNFAFSLLKKNYSPEQIPTNQIGLLLKSQHKFIREYALECMAANPQAYFADTELIASFLTGSGGGWATDQTTQQWAVNNWSAIVQSWGDDKCQIFMGRTVAALMQADHRTNANTVATLVRLVKQSFTPLLQKLSDNVALDLLGRVMRPEVALFGADIIALKYGEQPEKMPQNVLLALLGHSHDTICMQGRQTLDKYSDAAISSQISFFADLYFNHKNALVAALGKFLLLRALGTQPAIAGDLLNTFLPVLLRKETREGMHLEVFKTLTQQLEGQLQNIDRDIIFRLLNAEHLHAQELAALLIARFVDMTTFAVRNIVRLANHKILNVRQIAWRAFNAQIPRMRYEAEEALRILDSDWDDSRSFARTYFRNNFDAEVWTPQLLVSLCDSVREDVQAFGTELLTKFFTPENGTDYLLQLSQHPRPRLQLYATNYLDRYAADQPEVIAKLEQYFVTVLSQVNRGRVTKDRIFGFLHREALKNEGTAQLIADIISRISATGLIQDRSRCIEIMRDIHLSYNNIATAATFE